MKNKLLVGILLYIQSAVLWAHQPVMDMAPRWEGGYGIQIRQENFGSDDLLNDRAKVNNPLGLERYVRTTWLEGVYTFRPSTRVTFKLPYIEQERIKNIDSAPKNQTNAGIGDLILALPLKHYKNLGRNTSNLGVTPSVRLPTGSSRGDFPLSDGSFDFGLSVSYSAEGFPLEKRPSLKLYQLYDLFYWYNREGENGMREGNEIGLDINVGLHPYHNPVINSGFYLIWDITARHHADPDNRTLTTASGGSRVHSGPVFVYYLDNIMMRAEYKLPFYESASGIGLSRGQEFMLGIGATF